MTEVWILGATGRVGRSLVPRIIEWPDGRLPVS